jgi:hypothetical protein
VSHLSGSPRLRRAIGLTAVPALALSTFAALPSAPANAAEPDPLPLAAGTSWLKDQLTDGLVFNPNFGGFNDYGLSVDVGLALNEVGGEDTTIDAISTALADEIGGYVGDGTTESYAGSLAKAAVFAQTAGDDPEAYGGVDLIDRLEQRVSDTGVTLGRIQDLSAFGDFANTFGQTFAARALDEAGSSEAEAATEYLIAQQCDEGFFRQDFAALAAPDQDCDADPAAAPSTDVTALAVLALLPQADDTDVQAVIDAATAWLVSEQATNGSFGSGSDIPAPNTNSTGLAGWALGEAGETAAAEKAAIFVRALQVDEPEPCATALNGDQGAIAYDVAALTNGREDGITVALEDQWRRASAQALPALRWAPGDPGEASAIELKPFYQAGTRVQLTANGFIPGDTVCFRRGSKVVGLAVVGFDGSAKVGVTLPDGTAKRTYDSNSDQSEGQPQTFNVLDAKKLRIELKERVAKGGRQVVKIRGLVEGERFKAIYRGERVDTGRANSEGRGVARFAVGQKTGPVKVVVIGQFKNRRGGKAFTVTR